MHYTIYFNQKPLVLTDSKTPKVQELLQKPDTLLFEQLTETSVQEMLEKMQRPETAAGVFIHKPVEDLLQAFKRNMKVIEAGGGLVHTGDEIVLLIFRNGKWDLPKGKLDENESTAAAAVREVQEETGLENLQLEEHYEKEQKVVVLEDLISTGKSSLQVVEVLQAAGLCVLGMVSIFNYGFPQAAIAFEKAGVPFTSLTNYTALVQSANEHGLIACSLEEVLLKWRDDPANWTGIA